MDEDDYGYDDIDDDFPMYLEYNEDQGVEDFAEYLTETGRAYQ